MITRTQVAEIITAALASNNQPEDAQAFAAKLSIALDALGLTQFADIAEPEPVTLKAEPGNYAAPVEPTGAKSPDDWATTRNRKDPVS